MPNVRNDFLQSYTIRFDDGALLPVLLLYMRRIPDKIVEGVENKNLRMSSSFRCAVISQCNDSAAWISLFKELSNGIHSGRLPGGQPTYGVSLFDPN